MDPVTLAGWAVGFYAARRIYQALTAPADEAPEAPEAAPETAPNSDSDDPCNFPSYSGAVFTPDVAAAGLAAISGLNVVSEDIAKQLGNAKPITLKKLFYSENQVTDQNQAVKDQIFYIPDSEYDPQYDFDFTNYRGDDSNCSRGDYPYQRPSGWQRKAVRVIGRYEDDLWLGEQGWRSESSPGEWIVSYHGTRMENVRDIVMGGYDTSKCVRNLYGKGIYSSPDRKVAEAYAKGFVHKGKMYKCILQNRINPKERQEFVTGCGIYFVNSNHDDIRPYGICLKKI